MTTTTSSAGPRKPWRAVALGWLVPGAGHWYLGMQGKAIVLLVCLLTLFSTGWLLSWYGSGWAVDPVGHYWLFISQLCAGPISLVGWVAEPRMDTGLELAETTKATSASGRGAEVTTVSPNSPAAAAHLLPGDVILKCQIGEATTQGPGQANGEEIGGPATFRRAAWLSAPGSVMDLKIERRETPLTAHLSLIPDGLAPRLIDLGLVFTVVAGALNVVVMADAYARAAHLKREEQKEEPRD